jgi:uncharacterized protein involved in response to NO
LSTAFSPVDWHVHEMLYGYVPAVVTGFLLTAIPNWTGRLPLYLKRYFSFERMSAIVGFACVLFKLSPSNLLVARSTSLIS